MAFARLEALRSLRARGSLLGAVILLVTYAVGRWQSDSPEGFLVLGYLAAFAAAFSPGLSTDRSLSFDRLLVLDLMAPWEYAAGKTAAMAAWVGSSAAGAWTVAFLLSGFDLRFAGWYSAFLLLLAAAALPLVAATDLLLRIRLPAAAALLLALVALIVVMALSGKETSFLGALGLAVTPYSYASLGPLLVRACLGVAVTLGIVWAAAVGRGWRTPKPGARAGDAA